jgi:HK97 family phage major capsid protein
MLEKITEKLDAIEAANLAKVTEATEAVRTEMGEKIAALEAKIAEVQTPAIIRAPAKSLRQEVNRMVRSQLSEFVKSNSRVEKEIRLFEDESQYAAFLNEASALTGSGAGVGGRTAYDPVFVALRLMNPMRGLSRTNATDGATYQFRAKVGNAGATWGYAIQNNGAATTEATNIWQLTLQDLNVQFPIRTAALDDIDGLESNVVSDMLAEFSQVEAQSMILNSDQTDSPNTYGGTNGLRGLNQYPGANSSYTGGTISTAAFGTSGTGSSSGLHSLATYDQLTSNVNTVGANAIVYKDVINFIYSLPQQYWTTSAAFMINPILLQGIRGLVDTNGRPIYVDGLARDDGIVGSLLGFDVIVNKYLNNPSQATTGSAGTTSLYPMYFGDWQRGHGIVDRLNMVMRRYDQTAPGFITFFGEKRLATSVIDPNAIIRYRSTGTAT